MEWILLALFAAGLIGFFATLDETDESEEDPRD